MEQEEEPGATEAAAETAGRSRASRSSTRSASADAAVFPAAASKKTTEGESDEAGVDHPPTPYPQETFARPRPRRRRIVCFARGYRNRGPTALRRRVPPG